MQHAVHVDVVSLGKERGKKEAKLLCRSNETETNSWPQKFTFLGAYKSFSSKAAAFCLVTSLHAPVTSQNRREVSICQSSPAYFQRGLNFSPHKPKSEKENYFLISCCQNRARVSCLARQNRKCCLSGSPHSRKLKPTIQKTRSCLRGEASSWSLKLGNMEKTENLRPPSLFQWLLCLPVLTNFNDCVLASCCIAIRLDRCNLILARCDADEMFCVCVD